LLDETVVEGITENNLEAESDIETPETDAAAPEAAGEDEPEEA
jgi:hypothetical protein